MNKIKLLSLALLTFCAMNTAHASEHHSGHVMGSGGGEGGMGCLKARIAKFNPPHLATVTPGADISFTVANIHKPEQIVLTVKNEPIDFTSEFKEPFYVIKAKLPDKWVDTAVRINVKVNAKMSHCEAENGWLLKVGAK